MKKTLVIMILLLASQAMFAQIKKTVQIDNMYGIFGDNGGLGWIVFHDVSDLVGPQGATGLKGDTGPQGLQGLKGETGSQGSQGVAGIQGLKGNTGPTGVTGMAGTNGINGINGTPGVKGDKGDTGPQGIQGPTGGSSGLSQAQFDAMMLVFIQTHPLVTFGSVTCTGTLTVGTPGVAGSTGINKMRVYGITRTAAVQVDGGSELTK